MCQGSLFFLNTRGQGVGPSTFKLPDPHLSKAFYTSPSLTHSLTPIYIHLTQTQLHSPFNPLLPSIPPLTHMTEGTFSERKNNTSHFHILYLSSCCVVVLRLLSIQDWFKLSFIVHYLLFTAYCCCCYCYYYCWRPWMYILLFFSLKNRSLSMLQRPERGMEFDMKEKKVQMHKHVSECLASTSSPLTHTLAVDLYIYIFRFRL